MPEEVQQRHTTPRRELLAARAEWTKFSTLASNSLTLFAAFMLIAGLAVVLVWARSAESETPMMTELLTGVEWAQMLVAVLATVCACTEWSTGMHHVTFLAVPTRWPVLAGKAFVVGGGAFLVGVSGAACALAAGAVGGVDVAAEASLALRLICGTGVYLAGIAMLAVGIGFVVRHLVAGILTVLGFVWVLPLAFTLLPWGPIQHSIRFLPSPAGGLLIAAEQPASLLSPWGGGAVLLAWAMLSLATAAVVLRNRDV